MNEELVSVSFADLDTTVWTCRVRSAFKTSGTSCTKSMACKCASDNAYAVETHVNEPQRKNLKWLKNLEEKQASHLIRQFQGSILQSLRVLNELSGRRLALVAEVRQETKYSIYYEYTYT